MFEVNHVHHISIVGLQGELSRRNMQAFESVLATLSRCERRNIILNFQHLMHLDYCLVQRIIERIIEFQCDGGDLKVANANVYIQSILQAMGCDERLYPSVEEALLDFVGVDGNGDVQ